RPACRPHQSPGRLVSVDEELGPPARASAHAFPLLIEPALELGHLREMEPVEQAPAIQLQRLLGLVCLERCLELTDVARNVLIAGSHLFFTTGPQRLPPERLSQRVDRLVERVACMRMVEFGPE